MDEVDIGIEVEDIEQLAAVLFRRIRIPRPLAVYDLVRKLVKSVTPRNTDLIMSRIVAITIWVSAKLVALSVKMNPMLPPIMYCMYLHAVLLFGLPIWFIEVMIK